MVDVALQVHQSRLLLQNAVLETLGHGLHNFLLVGVALADVHVVTDADDVSHEADHVRGLAHGLAVGYLALALVQVLDLEAQQVAGRGEGETGPRGVVTEQADAQARLEDLRADVVLTHVPKGVSNREHGLQLVVRLVPGQEKVALVHVLEVQLVQLVYVHLQSLVHFYYSLSYSLIHLMSLSVRVARNWLTSAVLFSSLYRPGTAAYTAAQVTRSCFQVISFGAWAWLSAPGPKPTQGMP